MLLLNLMRVLVTLFAIGIIETCRRAWQLEGATLVFLIGAGMFFAFTAADLLELWLVDLFSGEEPDADYQ